jgi:anion-transporting  ArsA/GET3 family ATPase
MMPDVKRTFDGVVEELAPDPERLQRILHNRFYQELSTSLAGAIEFAAVEKLFEVYMSGRYDLIVLDTPPSQNAIDFLEAPGRLLEFLEQDHWQWLLRPYAAAAGLMSKKLTDYGSSFILRNLGKLAGLDTLRELAEFLFTFHGMYDEFRERSRRVRELLVSEELAFVIVTSTQPNQFPAVLALKDGLHQKDMRVRAVIVNRMRQDPLAQTGQTRAAASQRIGALFDGAAPGLQGQVEQAIDEEQAFAALASQAVTRLQTALGHTPVLPLPELPLDAHDQDSLVALQDALISQLAKA